MKVSAGRSARALQDLADGLSRRWFWMALGWNDVRQRFSGSLLGSFWITANLGLLVLALTLVFAHPLGARWKDYVPFLTVGLVVWQFVQATLIESSLAFVGAAETIRNAPMAFSIHVLRLIWRNILVFGHNAAIVAVVLVAFGVPVDTGLWLALPALLLLLFVLFWASLLLAVVGARFRDVQPLLAALTQLFFFVTPIIWPPSAVGPGREWMLTWNPLFALIDIVRAPLLGSAPAPQSWTFAAAIAAAAAAVGFAAFARWRGRLAYWV